MSARSFDLNSRLVEPQSLARCYNQAKEMDKSRFETCILTLARLMRARDQG